MSSDLLSTVGLALRAGRLELGEEPVGAACRACKARLLLLAADAADNTRRRAAHFAEAGKVPTAALPFSKEELGAAVGRNSCAMLALTDIGMAAALAKRLAALDEGQYGPLVSALDAKAQKAVQRQKEQARHDRKKRERRRTGGLGAACTRKTGDS